MSTSYEVVNEGGKTKGAKIDLAPQQRDGLEYEFTVVFDLSIDGHVATATKDRTSLFDGNYFTPDVGTGIKILQWLHSGGATSENDEPQTEAQQVCEPKRKNAFMLDTLDRMFNQLGLGVHSEAYHAYVCDRYRVDEFEDLEANQLTEQINLLRQCKMREEKLKQFIGILKQHKKAAQPFYRVEKSALFVC